MLDGNSALVIMATGDGKSLCYQLPGLMQEGVTLVVSPLIALMEDQVQALQKKGIAATCIHSMLDKATRQQRLQEALEGKYSLLYVTPERFRVGSFLQKMQKIQIPMLAIDEAHCVSHWGHDFRPDYSRLGEVREALGSPPTIALTATATPDVQKDILKVLRLEDSQLFHTGIERENLFLAVHEVHTKEEKLGRILQTMQSVGGPGIVYTALIRDLHFLEEELLRRNYKPLVYHGKLSAYERLQQQKRFIETPDQIILATNAFGMGVDKANIRFILHYQIPRTLEAYYQEIGRAGRDGLGSYCELVYLEEDVSIQRNFTEWANPDQKFMQQIVGYLSSQGDRLHSIDLDELRDTFLIKQRHDGRVETCLRLLTTAGCVEGELGRNFSWLRNPTQEEVQEWLPDDKRKRDLMGLLKMVQYAGTNDCRKQNIHDYFGFADTPDTCGACDACVAAETWLQKTLPQEQRKVIPQVKASVVSDGDAELQRGDWIEVRGHGLCAVKRVHKAGKGFAVDVELAKDLSERRLDLKRVQWRKVQN